MMYIIESILIVSIIGVLAQFIENCAKEYESEYGELFDELNMSIEVI